MAMGNELQEKAINTIRFLSADGVQAANSGHPGLPMGTAAMAYTIWTGISKSIHQILIGLTEIVLFYPAAMAQCWFTACFT